MDNCAYSCNDIKILNNIFENLKDIFNPYQFHLQQFLTNYETLQTQIVRETNTQTSQKVKFFGMEWNRLEDSLAAKSCI